MQHSLTLVGPWHITCYNIRGVPITLFLGHVVCQYFGRFLCTGRGWPVGAIGRGKADRAEGWPRGRGEAEGPIFNRGGRGAEGPIFQLNLIYLHSI